MTNQAENSFKKRLIALVPRLSRYARVLTPGVADADDLLQATCERALTRWSQWRPDSNFDAWMFTIMSSVWKNELRSRAIRRGQGFVDLNALEPEDAPKSAHAPTAERNIFLQQVLTLIMTLPENQRELVLLVYVEGYQYQEAAEILDIPVGTVMSRLSRARMALSDAIDKIPSTTADEHILSSRL